MKTFNKRMCNIEVNIHRHCCSEVFPYKYFMQGVSLSLLFLQGLFRELDSSDVS